MDSLFQSALVVMQGAMPAASVAVVYGGTTGTGKRDNRTTAASLDSLGERGESTSKVFLSRADWPNKPERGSDISVAGVASTVKDVSDDMAGAFWGVEYQEKQGVTG